MTVGTVLLLISSVLAIYIGILTRRPVSHLTDTMKCPFCYGIDLCKEIDDKRISLRYNTFSEVFYNLFSVKNVFFGELLDGEKVVLKKLGHQNELSNIQRTDDLTKDVILQLMGNLSNFITCNREVQERFLVEVISHFDLEHIWTILQVNVEPLILTVFQSGNWSVPKLLGRCGFLIVEQDCGLPLNHFQYFSWKVRALLALQLLEAAIDFTVKHEAFRLYLTDISPDNIAVDENFNLYFVDLENVILKEKLQLTEDSETILYSEDFPEEDFVFNDVEVCESSISDHNVYSVCRLLLSRSAPWPMMAGGLLHSPPHRVETRYYQLFQLVEKCVYSEEKLSRFYIAKELIKLLKKEAESIHEDEEANETV